MIRTFTFLLFLLPLLSNAQTNWQHYFNTTTIFCVADSGNVLWAGTSGHVVRYDKTTGNTTFYDPAGFSDGCYPYRSVVLDSTGNVWVAATSYGHGLFRYDGTGWTNFNNPQCNLPVNLYVAPDNKLWFDNSGYKMSFDGTTFVQEGFYTGPMVIDFNGVAWTATSNGIMADSGATSILYDTSNSPLPDVYGTAITLGLDGTIWCAMQQFDTLNFTYSYFLAGFDGTSWTIFDTTNSNYPTAAGGIISMTVDTSGVIWLCSNYSNLLVAFDGTSFTTQQTPFTAAAGTIYCDRDNVMWLPTHGEGLHYFTTAWQTADLSNAPLTGNSIHAMEVDAAGNLWIGSDDVINNSTWPEGNAKFDGSTWTTWTSSDPYSVPNNHSRKTETDANGNVWCFTQFGLYRYAANTWTQFPTGCTYRGDIAFGQSGEVWIGNDNPGSGVRLLTGNTFTTVYPTVTSNVFSLAVDLNNKVWAGTQWSLERYDGNNIWTTYTCNNSPMPCGFVDDIEIDVTGMFWMAIGGTLVRYDGNSSWLVYDTSNSDLPLYPGIMEVEIDPAGQIWMGSLTGLYKFDGTNWTHYSTANSNLQDDNVTAIAIDPGRAGVWAGTYCGAAFMVDSSIISGVGDLPAGINLALSAFPNPSLDAMTVSFTLATPDIVSWELLDVTGKMVQRGIPVQGVTGLNQISIQKGSLAGSMYFLRVNAGDVSGSVRVIFE